MLWMFFIFCQGLERKRIRDRVISDPILSYSYSLTHTRITYILCIKCMIYKFYLSDHNWATQFRGPHRMILILFLATFVLELIYILMFILTIRGHGFRFWPPPSARSWQFFVSWFLALIVAGNFFYLGLLDFDSFGLPHFWFRLPIALILLLFSSVIGFWVYSVFPFRSTIGLGSRLVIKGPYRYSRNPQYIVDSVSALAYMLLTNSWMACVIGTLGIILNLLAPFTEEPWLEEQFGNEYREYKVNVPRFFRLGKKEKWPSSGSRE
jgi:protein-S-isoprenylcysteine O-methyltransferase Ste14